MGADTDSPATKRPLASRIGVLQSLDRRADATDPQLGLLVVQRITLMGDVTHRLAQPIRIGDGVGGTGRQPGALDVVATGLDTVVSQEQLAGGGDMQRRPAADDLFDPHDSRRGHPFHVNHLVALAHAQIDGLAGPIA